MAEATELQLHQEVAEQERSLIYGRLQDKQLQLLPDWEVEHTLLWQPMRMDALQVQRLR